MEHMPFIQQLFMVHPNRTVLHLNLSVKQTAPQSERTQTYFTVYFKKAYEGGNVANYSGENAVYFTLLVYLTVFLIAVCLLHKVAGQEECGTRHS